jgi:hypothetical protein
MELLSEERAYGVSIRAPRAASRDAMADWPALHAKWRAAQPLQSTTFIRRRCRHQRRHALPVADIDRGTGCDERTHCLCMPIHRCQVKWGGAVGSCGVCIGTLGNKCVYSCRMAALCGVTVREQRAMERGREKEQG